tara:strand:- start:12036 stop:12884 length:849 start_codon:yes stop_codon:yes gene_type:complete
MSISEEIPGDVEPGLPEEVTSSNTTPPGGDWKADLPEELRTDPNIDKYTSFEGLAKGHLNAISHLGKDKLIKPNSDDEWNSFYNEMGRPEEAKGYEFDPIETPDGFEINDDMVNNFRDAAHGAGLSTDQAKKLYDWYVSNDAAQFETGQTNTQNAVHDSETTMRKEWGNAYEQNMDQAMRAVREFGGDEIVELLDSTGLGNNADVIKTFARIGQKMMGDTQLEGSANAVKTPAQLKERIASIQNNPGFYDAENLERPGMVREMKTLMEELHGNQVVGGASVG